MPDTPPPDDDSPPEASGAAVLTVQLPEAMYIYEPFTFSGQNGEGHNAKLIARDDRAGLGAFAHVQCDCGQPFRVDLLNPDIKQCPKCKTRYTHFLVFAAEDDPDVLAQTWEHLLTENGVPFEPAAGDDQADAGDDDPEPDGQ